MNYRLFLLTLCALVTGISRGKFDVEISAETLVDKINRHLHDGLLQKSEDALTDYVCELQAFIPEYTEHSWDAIRPLVLQKIDLDIAFNKKNLGRSINLQECHEGFNCLTIGLISGIIAATLDEFLFAAIRAEKTALGTQFNITEHTERIAHNRTRTTFSSSFAGPEKNTALTRYKKLYDQERVVTLTNAIPVLTFAITAFTALVTIPLGSLAIVSSLLNPHYKERYEKLCLFKKLIEEIQQYDKYKYPTPLIVDLAFFTRD